MKPSTLLRRLLLMVVSLTTALMLIAALVNLSVFDEDLIPELSDIMQAEQSPPHNDNAYLAMWGISATADRDMIDAGVGLVERSRENRGTHGQDTLTASDYMEILGKESPDEAWLDGFQCNARTTTGCLSAISANLKETPVTSQRAQLLFERHQHILQMTTYYNVFDLSHTSPLPPFVILLKLSRIELARLAGSDSPMGFMEQISVDMRFWKMILEDGSSVLDKMIGVAGMWNDLQFLSDYLASNELSGSERQFARSLLGPLTDSQLDISDSFKSEQRVVSRTLDLILNHRSTFDFGPLVSAWLIQPNATLNSHYQHLINPLLHLSALSRVDFAAQTRIVDGIRRTTDNADVEEMTRIWPGTPYNLGGKIFLKRISGGYSAYIARVHDLNSMIGLVDLQLQLLSKSMVSIEDLLDHPDQGELQISEELKGKDLEFDANDGWLQFECLYGQRSLCKIRLKGERGRERGPVEFISPN